MLKNGNWYRDNGQKGPKTYYPKALYLYKQILKIDPANAEAKAKGEEIENIYKSMNRPVPEV